MSVDATQIQCYNLNQKFNVRYYKMNFQELSLNVLKRLKLNVNFYTKTDTFFIELVTSLNFKKFHWFNLYYDHCLWYELLIGAAWQRCILKSENEIDFVHLIERA